MSSKKPIVGQVIPPVGAVPAAMGLDALTQLVSAAQDCITVMATERTKQEKIAAYRATEVAKIEAAESILKKYFSDVAAERRSMLDGLFERLDRALDDGDSAVVSQMVNAVVDVARTSPLSDLGDLSQIRLALDDADHVWEL